MRNNNHRGPEYQDRNNPHRNDPEPKRKKKKKKKKHHTFLWILLLVLIVGILLGILIDQGIIAFPGGQGWIGGAIGSITNKGQNDNDPSVTDGASVTPVATETPNKGGAEAYIKISENKVSMNDVEITVLTDLIAQLNTETYKGGNIFLIDDYATKAVFDEVKKLLEDNGLEYSIKE